MRSEGMRIDNSPHTRTQDMGLPTGVKGTLFSTQANSRSISTH